jgi:hypothetical protein
MYDGFSILQGDFSMEWLFISVALVAAIGLLEFIQHHSQ